MNVPLQGILVGTNETLKVQTQKTFNNNNFLSYLLCAGVAGAVAATLTTPLDVVKTKLQTQDTYQKSHSGGNEMNNENQKTSNKKNNINNINNSNKKSQIQSIYKFSSKPVSGSETVENLVQKSKYQNILQTFKLILQEEGMRGLFRGFGSRIIMTSPSSAISWASYEVMKKYLVSNKFSH